MKVEFIDSNTVKIDGLYEMTKHDFLQHIFESASEPKTIVATNVVEREIKPQVKSLDIEVTDVLKRIGVPAHIKGYQYIRDAVMMAVKDLGIINSITSQLYPPIARKYNTTPSRTERAIRHAIEVGFSRGDVGFLTELFPACGINKGKATNSEFIATIADALSLRRKAG